MSKSLSEEFKDQKINDLLEEFLLLEKEIKIIPEKLTDALQSVKYAIDNLPPEIEGSIELLVKSLEDAENSYKQIEDKHRAVLQNQLDEVKIELRQNINLVVSESLKEAHLQISALTAKIEIANKATNFTNQKSWKAITIMGCVTFLAIAALVLQNLV